MASIIYSELLGKLQTQIKEVLKSKERVLISVVGRGGVGKSYFGRYVRKNGVGQFDKRAVLVVDDGVMWLDCLYFFRRKVRLAYSGVDELKPVIRKLPKRKKIIFYINATPSNRISMADILLKLSTDEETRKQRLRQRYGNKNPARLKKMFNNCDTSEYNIKYTYLLEAKV